MPKAKKKKVTSYRHTQHHHDASNNLLLILAGGFVVLVGVTYILGTDMSSAKPQYQEVVAQEKESPVQEVVTIKSSAYTPETITVKVGTKVTWVNEDLEPHSATADDGSFDTGVMQSGEEGSVTFEKAGTYGYYCIPHPWMRGTIVVEE